MNILDDGTDEEIYKYINQMTLDANVMNMSFIILEVKYGASDTDYSLCYGNYIIKFFCVHIPFNQTLVFMGKVISSSETVFEGPYLFPINIISIIMFYKELNPLTKLFPPGD